MRLRISLLAMLSLGTPAHALNSVSASQARCTIEATSRGSEWALSLRVETGRSPLTVEYFTPVMLRELVVRHAGARGALAEPAVDMGVQRQTLRLAPNARADVAVISRLRFRPSSGPLLSSNRFVITIDRSPAQVDLEGVFGQGRSALACRGVLRP